MDLKNLYFEVKAYIEKLDFDRLWAGFQPLKFALYTDDECFFDGSYIPKTDAFLANTAIFHNGEWIAIWKVQEQMDTRILASKLVHEMFHGFQQLRGERRFPDDLDALYHYGYNPENLSLKAAENRRLARLAEQFDQETFARLLQGRKYRMETFPYDYRYEACIEQIEGAANFVELLCLKQLSEDLFRQKLSTLRKRLRNSGNLLPIRVICYDIGAVLLYVLTENGIAFDRSFSTLPFSEALLQGVESKKGISDPSAEQLVAQFHADAARIIQKAIRKNDLVTATADTLLAVNIYNAVYHDNHIISHYFVMFGSEGKPRIEYGDFVIESPEPKKLTRIYRI